MIQIQTWMAQIRGDASHAFEEVQREVANLLVLTASLPAACHCARGRRALDRFGVGGGGGWQEGDRRLEVAGLVGEYFFCQRRYGYYTRLLRRVI